MIDHTINSIALVPPPDEFLGKPGDTYNKDRLETQSTVIKLTGLFCSTSLYTLILLQRHFGPYVNPFFAKLCSPNLLLSRHLFQGPRRAHLACERIKAARVSSSMVDHHIYSTLRGPTPRIVAHYIFDLSLQHTTCNIVGWCIDTKRTL